MNNAKAGVCVSADENWTVESMRDGSVTVYGLGVCSKST